MQKNPNYGSSHKMPMKIVCNEPLICFLGDFFLLELSLMKR